jgi:hypothetical protein
MPPTHSLEKTEPKLPSEDTLQQQVIYGFFLLIAQHSEAWMGKVSSLQSISRPTTVVRHKPASGRWNTWGGGGAQDFQIRS